MIIRWDRIGDAVLTVPIITGIKSAFPAVQIDLVCSESNQFIFKGNPLIHNLIVLPGFARAYGLQRIKDTIASLFNRKLKLIDSPKITIKYI